MHTVDLTIPVGPDPDTGEPIELSHDAFEAGCYVAGPAAQPRTGLLHDWCVAWAERGHGFWYVHPRGPAPRELLARLPADRLDDVVWIDYARSALAARLDVPPVRRVGVDPFADSAATIDPDALVTPPAVGRSGGWVAAAGEAEQYFDWNVARVLDTVVPLMIGRDGPARTDVTARCSAAVHDDDPTPLVELVDEAAAARQLRQAHAHDDQVFRKVSQCLSWPTDPFASNPLLGEATYAVEDALSRRDIVLVTGALPAPDAAQRSPRDVLGTHVLVQTLVRRLWEAAQTAGAAAQPTPLLLDGLPALSPDRGTLIPELLEHAPATPLAPVLAAPELGELDDRLRLPLTRFVDTRVQYLDPTTPGTDPLPTGDNETMARAIEREQSSPIDAGVRCLVSTGNAGLLTGDPRTATPTRTARPPDPPRTRHDAATVADAITASVDRHGTIPAWVTDEMLREVREE